MWSLQRSSVVLMWCWVAVRKEQLLNHPVPLTFHCHCCTNPSTREQQLCHTGGTVEKEFLAVHGFPQWLCYIRYKLYKFSRFQVFYVAETVQPVFRDLGLSVEIITGKDQAE